MPKIPLSIANGFYESRSLPFSAQRCVNWYPSYAENDALSEAAIFGTPGTETLASADSDVDFSRGADVVSGVPYFVNGTTLYRLDRFFNAANDEEFNAVAIDTVPGAGFVSMDDNGTELCIVIPGVSGFIYNVVTEVFTQITDPGFTANGKSERVVFVDGYFVHIAGKNIFHSYINQGLEYDSLDVGQAQADPDDIVSSIVYKNQLMILGRETIEVFANVGKFPFTFQRIPGYFVPIGCFAAFTPIEFNQAFAFLGGATREKAGMFWGSAQNFQRISTTPIEQKIQESSDSEISNAFTWTYSEDGAVFLGLVIADHCFVYDANASKMARKHIWHERKSTRTELANKQIRWRVNAMVEAYGRIIVADAFSGDFGSISLNVFEEFENFIQRKLSTTPLSNQGENLFVDEVELTMESGITTDDDNVIKLRWSDDNKVYNDPLPADIGIDGDFTLRQYWRRLGHVPRFRTFEFSYSGRDKSVLLKMEVTLDSSGQ